MLTFGQFLADAANRGEAVNYKRVLSHNQTKSSIYVLDRKKLPIRWACVHKNTGEALDKQGLRRVPTSPEYAGSRYMLLSGTSDNQRLILSMVIKRRPCQWQNSSPFRE